MPTLKVKKKSKFKEFCEKNKTLQHYTFFRWCRENGCKIKVDTSYKKFLIREVDFRFIIGMPSNYMKTSNNNFYEIKTIMKHIQKSHPHFNDIQEYMNIKVNHNKSYENKTLYDVVKSIGKIGKYNCEIKMPDKKPYKPDYYVPHPIDGNKVLFLIECKEEYHNIPRQSIDDDIREREMEALYGTEIIEFFKGESEDDKNDRINEMKNILNIYKKNYIIDKLKKDMPNAYSLAEDFEIDISNEDVLKNPFVFPLGKIKQKLKIEPNSDLEKRIDSYFYNNAFNPVEEDSDSDSDSESEDEFGLEDEFEKIDISDIKKENYKTTSFEINKDYIINSNEFMLNRKSVMEIALKTDTPEGKKIFEDLMSYEEMLKKMIEIDYERRNSLIKLTNEKRLKRAYNDRIKRFFESKIKQTEINLKSIINRHLKTLQIKLNKIKTLEKENQILKDRIRELESKNT